MNEMTITIGGARRGDLGVGDLGAILGDLEDDEAVRGGLEHLDALVGDGGEDDFLLPLAHDCVGEVGYRFGKG